MTQVIVVFIVQLIEWKHMGVIVNSVLEDLHIVIVDDDYNTYLDFIQLYDLM